jgi:hypothetical protein
MASTPRPGEAAFVRVSRVTPGWVRRRPLLLAGWLRLSNRVRRMKYAWLVALLVLGALVWVITRPEAAATLAFLADRWFLGFLGAAIHAGSSVSRRKLRLQAEHENSWLAALPYRVSVPARIAFGFGVQLVLIAVLCAGIAAASSAPWLDARAAWLGVLGGYVAGGLAGWFAHVFSPKNAVGVQYAIVRRVREKWAMAPKLHPLSYWPVAAARAAANPQVSMRTMLFALLALPMGTTGAEAIAVGAAWMVAVYLVLSLVATVRTAFAAGWWLRPTPVESGRFTRTLVSRVLLIQTGVFVAAVLAVAAIGRPQIFYLTVSATIVWLPLYVAVAMVACAVALRPKKPSIAGRLEGSAR